MMRTTMLRGRIRRAATAIIVIATLSAALPGSAQQSPAAGATADLSGVWSNIRRPEDGPWWIYSFSEDPPPLTAWGEARFDAARPQRGPRGVSVSETDDLVYQCFPPGVPRIYLHPFPFEIIQLPGRVMIVYEYDHLIRQVYTGGRPHRDDLAPSWMGDSIGVWEDGTLVVETVNFNDRTWLDRRAVPHSEQMRLIERFSIDADGNLRLEMRVEDPIALAEPWTFERVFEKTDWTIEELVCMDNVNYESFENSVLEFSE